MAAKHGKMTADRCEDLTFHSDQIATGTSVHFFCEDVDINVAINSNDSSKLDVDLAVVLMQRSKDNKRMTSSIATAVA